MSVEVLVRQGLATVTEVGSLAHLSRVLRPEHNGCVWRRTAPFEPQSLPWLTPDRFGRITRAKDSVRPLLVGVSGSLAEEWAADIAMLAGALCDLLGAPAVHASLASITTDKCRKFHTDYKTLRLVCTYRGPGTEWVEDRHVVREAMEREDPCILEANARIVPRGSTIRRAGAGDVLAMKGHLFSGSRGHGVVHRSPPIEATGEHRIVLTLDEA